MILANKQAEGLARYQSACTKIHEAILRANALNHDNELKLPPIRTESLGHAYGESLRLGFDADLAEHKLRIMANVPMHAEQERRAG